MRRNTGASSNNLNEQVNGGSDAPMMLQRSLNVQSNHSSIVVDVNNNKAESKKPQNGAIVTNTASEYGPMSFVDAPRISQ